MGRSDSIGKPANSPPLWYPHGKREALMSVSVASYIPRSESEFPCDRGGACARAANRRKHGSTPIGDTYAGWNQRSNSDMLKLARMGP